MTSGEAPAMEARTWIVGKSTVGRDDTGSTNQAATPVRAIPMVSRMVATGRRIKASGRLMDDLPYSAMPGAVSRLGPPSSSGMGLGLKRAPHLSKVT